MNVSNACSHKVAHQGLLAAFWEKILPCFFRVTLDEKRKGFYTDAYACSQEESDNAGLQLECIAVAKLKPFIVPAELMQSAFCHLLMW